MAKILIVDDEQEMRDISAQIFEIEGHEVETASEAEDAIIKVQNNNYDFILVDLVLPGRMNGLDIIKSVKSESPDTYIVAYSGFSGIDISEKVIRAGANGFITKPFRRQELIDVVNNMWADKTPQQEIIK